MNIYKGLNEITKYIDDNITEKIEYSRLAKMVGINSNTLQRIFVLLSNITLSEYIRKRRLTLAGCDLKKQSVKVMDIAIKYQYENASSFSRAFEKFHGIKPSKVNKSTKSLKNFPRIIFDEITIKNSEFEYQIVEKDEFTLYGVSIDIDVDTKKTIPAFYKEINKKYAHTGEKIAYGMMSYKDYERDIYDKYYILFVNNIDSFEKVVIPKNKWIVIRINSRKAKDIQNAIKIFYLEFLPSCNYNVKGSIELEYYSENYTEFLIPIQ